MRLRQVPENDVGVFLSGAQQLVEWQIESLAVLITIKCMLTVSAPPEWYFAAATLSTKKHFVVRPDGISLSLFDSIKSMF